MENEAKIYDAAIIGGGIAGAAIARDAALRGLSVVLFEKNTFGSGTSSKSSKLIHGGIRYLEIAWNALKRLDFREFRKNLRFVRLSLKESRILRHIAPDLVISLPLLVPLYKTDKRKPLAVYAGAIAYFLLARLSGEARPPKIFFSKASFLKQLPQLKPEGLKGGVMIWDHLTDDLELVRRTARWAKVHGADCFENTEVVRYEADAGVYKISVRQGGQEKNFYSRKLVDAAGPWVDRVRALGNEKNGDYILPVAGSHIEVKKFLPCSVLLQAEDNRVFFVINLKYTARIGTTEWLCRDPDRVTPPNQDVDYLLRSLSRYFPAEKIGSADILKKDAGVRPLAISPSTQDPNQTSRDHEIKTGPTGVLHVLGVKLTDHRRAAEAVVDRLTDKKSTTASTLLV